MTESIGFLDDEEGTLPGELPFDQELDFNEDFSDDDYSIDIWDEDADDEDLESDDDY